MKKEEMTYWMKGLMRLGILLAAVVLTAGCGGSGSGDEPGTPSPGPGTVTPGPVPSETPAPIAFSAQQEEEQDVTRAGRSALMGTRASTPLESKNVNLFTVWGYKNMSYEGGSYGSKQKVFPGYTVEYTPSSDNTTTTNSDGWEYVGQELLGQEEQTVKYWDWSAKAYRFFAVTEPYTKVDVTETNEAVKLKFHIDLRTTEGIDAVPYYSHLWFSNNNYEEYRYRQYGNPVVLEFLKPVCQVRIMFIYEDPANNRISTPLEEISFHRSDGVTIKHKGEVTITYPLSGTGISETFSDTNASAIDGLSRDYREDEPNTSDNEEDHFWYHVLPCTGQGSFTLDVLVDGDPKKTVVPAEFMDWKPGYNYTYIFKIHVDGSVAIDAVQSAFTGWTITSKDHTVYNW